MSLTFTLQPVLNYRQRIVESLEMALARLLRAEQDTLKDIAMLREVEHDLFADLAARQQGLIDLTVVFQLRAQLKTVGARLAVHTRTLNEVRQQIANVRTEIVNAQQEKETLENLKAKDELNGNWQKRRAKRASATTFTSPAPIACRRQIMSGDRLGLSGLSDFKMQTAMLQIMVQLLKELERAFALHEGSRNRRDGNRIG